MCEPTVCKLIVKREKTLLADYGLDSSPPKSAGSARTQVRAVKQSILVECDKGMQQCDGGREIPLTHTHTLSLWTSERKGE